MKKILILAVFTTIFANDKISYDAIFNELSKPKKTISKDKIDQIYDPFSDNSYQNFKDQIEYGGADLNLEAIFENRVKISSKWYQKNDIINGYKIIKISPDVVILRENGNEIRLKIKKENENVKIR